MFFHPGARCKTAPPLPCENYRRISMKPLKNSLVRLLLLAKSIRIQRFTQNNLINSQMRFELLLPRMRMLRQSLSLGYIDQAPTSPVRAYHILSKNERQLNLYLHLQERFLGWGIHSTQRHTQLSNQEHPKESGDSSK